MYGRAIAWLVPKSNDCSKCFVASGVRCAAPDSNTVMGAGKLCLIKENVTLLLYARDCKGSATVVSSRFVDVKAILLCSSA